MKKMTCFVMSVVEIKNNLAQFHSDVLSSGAWELIKAEIVNSHGRIDANAIRECIENAGPFCEVPFEKDWEKTRELICCEPGMFFDTEIFDALDNDEQFVFIVENHKGGVELTIFSKEIDW